MTKSFHIKSNSFAVAGILNRFAGLYDPLSNLLDTIKNEGQKGKPLPKTSAIGKPLPVLPPEGVTDAGAKAYSDAVNKAKAIIEPVVRNLTNEEVGYLSGIGFTDPNDDAKKRIDITNSIHAAWDKAAAKYMKLDVNGGDAARADMLKRLQEFDAAIKSTGVIPASPDK